MRSGKVRARCDPANSHQLMFHMTVEMIAAAMHASVSCGGRITVMS